MIDKAPYFSRTATEILSDSTKFEKIGAIDFTATVTKTEKQLRSKMLGMRKSGQLTEDQYEAIRPLGSQLPRLYGLPKIHKHNFPFRPILSMSNSPQEKLAKWLLVILQPAVKLYTKYCVKDSFTFALEMKSLNAPSENVVMTSYDVTSLFTNVPVKEAIKISADYLYSVDNPCQPPITRSVFIELMELATIGVEFVFGDTLYKQIEGVAMGSQLGPSLANIFLGFHEEKLFAVVQPPLYYRRYVDDTFVLFASNKESALFHERLNSMHNSLKFTSEGETQNKLAFLDVLVERSQNRWITTVHRKSTFTGQYMHWSSFAPRQRKLDLIHTLTLRALSICSPSRLDSELQQVEKILVDNGYPLEVVKFHISKRTSIFTSERPFGPHPCPLYVKLPWIGERSIIFEKQLQDSVKLCFGPASLRVCYSTKPLMKFAIKDPLPTLARSNVVYMFECLCEKRYVGRTEQRLADRITQHVPSTIRKPKVGKKLPDASKQSSAIAKHLCENAECAAAYDPDRFTVLDQARTSFHLATLEASYIASMKPILCRQKTFVYTLRVFGGL